MQTAGAGVGGRRRAAAFGADLSMPRSPFPFAEEAGLTVTLDCASTLLSNAAAEEWKLARCPCTLGSSAASAPEKVPARTRRVSCAATSRAQSSLQPRGRNPWRESPGSGSRELVNLMSMRGPLTQPGIKDGKGSLHQELGFGWTGPIAAGRFLPCPCGTKPPMWPIC
jgi:hypothetical protein